MRPIALFAFAPLLFATSALAQTDPAGATGATGSSGSTSGTASGNTSSTAPPPPPIEQAPPEAEPEPEAEPQGAPSYTAAPAAATDEEERSPSVILEGMFGYSYADVAVFSNSGLLPSIARSNGSGYTAGAMFGFRLFNFLILGARASLSSYPGFDIATGVFDAQVRITIGDFEPYIRGGFGYGWMGNADYSAPGGSDTSGYGLVVEGGGGFDFFVSKVVAIGVGLDLAFLNFSRQRTDQGCSGRMGTMNACDPTEITPGARRRRRRHPGPLARPRRPALLAHQPISNIGPCNASNLFAPRRGR